MRAFMLMLGLLLCVATGARELASACSGGCSAPSVGDVDKGLGVQSDKNCTQETGGVPYAGCNVNGQELCRTCLLDASLAQSDPTSYGQLPVCDCCVGEQLDYQIEGCPSLPTKHTDGLAGEFGYHRNKTRGDIQAKCALPKPGLWKWDNTSIPCSSAMQASDNEVGIGIYFDPHACPYKPDYNATNLVIADGCGAGGEPALTQCRFCYMDKVKYASTLGINTSTDAATTGAGHRQLHGEYVESNTTVAQLPQYPDCPCCVWCAANMDDQKPQRCLPPSNFTDNSTAAATSAPTTLSTSTGTSSGSPDQGTSTQAPSGGSAPPASGTGSETGSAGGLAPASDTANNNNAADKTSGAAPAGGGGGGLLIVPASLAALAVLLTSGLGLVM